MKLKSATFLKDLRLPGTSSFKSQVQPGQPPTFDIWCDGAWVWVEKIRGVGAGEIIGVPREALSSIVPANPTDVPRPGRSARGLEQHELAELAQSQLVAHLTQQNQQFNTGQAQLSQAQLSQQLAAAALGAQTRPAGLESGAAIVQPEPAAPEPADEDDEPVTVPGRRRGGR